MIRVKHLTKKYGSRYAVQDLSFTLEPGKIYGFLGPNGAGKSTTMNMITGYLGPTSGTVEICGYDIQEEPEKAKSCIGYLPEIPPLYVDMTVYEYLLTVAELKKTAARQRDEMISLAMDQIQITDRRDRLIRNLSKGYRQRVGIAQTLIGNPEIIILDEPSVGLDPKQLQDMRALIRNLGKEHTVILSSHILSEISAVCDDVLIINKGRLIAQGNPEALEKMGFSGNRIHLLAEGKEDALKDLLLSLPHIRNMKIEAETVKRPEDKGEDQAADNAQEVPRYRISLQEESGFDIRKSLFFAFAKAGFPILEIYRENRSLEELFLELTDDQAADRKETMGKEAENGAACDGRKEEQE